MLVPVLLRELRVDAGMHPRGQHHLSAASALAIALGHLYFVADDEHHLGCLPLDASMTEPVGLHRLAAGDLPPDPAARKRRKPDLEALLAFGPGAVAARPVLLALGSGSRPNRERGFLVELDAAGLPQAVRDVDLARLYAPLRDRFADLNIEGAFATGATVHLLQRANAGAPRNACIRYPLPAFLAWLTGAAAPPAFDVTEHALGSAGDVPYGFTDAAAWPGGGWVFSAVAEATTDSYRDGACAGSMVGRMSASGDLLALEPLAGAPKVEGVAVRGPGRLLLVTDADDPARPSQLLGLDWPAAPA